MRWLDRVLNASVVPGVVAITMGLIFSAAILVSGYYIFRWLYLVYRGLN